MEHSTREPREVVKLIRIKETDYILTTVLEKQLIRAQNNWSQDPLASVILNVSYT